MNKSKTFSLYPYFVCRVSGLPTDSLESLRSDLLKNLNSNLFDELGKIEQLKNHLSEKIYELIKINKERKIRSRLIFLRRELFNEKVHIKLNEAIYFSDDILILILSLKEKLEKKLVLVNELEECYYNEKKRIKNTLIDYLQNEDFQKGLLLSSKSLYSLQNMYKKTDQIFRNRKIEQIERGLLRYFTRTSMKATPFGTFCSIIPGKVNGVSNNSILKFSSDPSRKKSLLLINKDIYGLISNYIRKEPEIRKKLSVELNKTIEKKETVFYFLTEIDSKEIFQRVKINPVLELLEELFSKKTVKKYEELIIELASSEKLEATNEEVEAYIDKLIEIGYLRFKIGIPEQMVDWSTPLIQILSSTDSEKADRICKAIESLRKKMKDYESNNVEKRTKDLEEISRILEEVFNELGIKANIRSNIPLYEDATSESFAYINITQIEDIKKSLFNFIRLTNKLAYPRGDHANMRHFYDSYYGASNKDIGLLEFYEDYYREHLKNHLEKQKRAYQKKDTEELNAYDLLNPFNIELIKKIQSAVKKISLLIAKKWNDNPSSIEINITSDELQVATEDVKDSVINNMSVSLFAQLIQSDKNHDARMILPNGQYLSGFGKYFSRFLYLFGHEVLEGIYKENSHANGEVLAEISGDANFNANLHPPLLKYEISYPTSEIGLAEIPIKCTDIVVTKDPNDSNRLMLKKKSENVKIVPLDLGFLNPLMRPPLFQLLSKFSPPCGFSINIPEQPFLFNGKVDNNKDDKTEKDKNDLNQKGTIVYRPRILFEEKIVLSRQSWIVPKNLLPQITNEESDFAYFMRINKWRNENGIPDEVYIRIKPLPIQILDAKQSTKQAEHGKLGQTVQTIEEKQKYEEEKIEDKMQTKPRKNETKHSKISRDFYKPQYIDFYNPLMVDLMGKMTVGLKNCIVTIEERYPGKEQLPSYGKKSFSVEQIFQVDSRNN